MNLISSVRTLMRSEFICFFFIFPSWQGGWEVAFVECFHWEARRGNGFG